MDVVEVRLRLLELCSRTHDDPDTIIRAVLSLEQFVNDAGVASTPPTSDNGGSTTEAPAT